MTTSNTLLSMVIALKPKFRSKQDRVAFATHAYMIAQGFKLEAVGTDAETASTSASIKSNQDDVDLTGWNTSPDAYTFLYNPDLWQQGGESLTAPLLLKVVSLGDQLLLNLVTLNSAEQEPKQLELSVDHYTTSKSELPACYQNLDKLVGKLSSKIGHPAQYLTQQQTQPEKPQHAAAASTRQEPAPDYNAADDEFPQDPRRYGQPPSGILGSGDAVPAGFRPPGYGNLQDPFPGGMGRSGGMHMGPDDPLFAGRSGLQRPGRPGLHPPGARYDPIGPPGMPGFNPDDFQRGRGELHPDLAQPGPGRGTDWDSMFG